MVRTLNSELHSIHNYMNASIVVIKTIYGMKSILSRFQFTIKIQNHFFNSSALHYVYTHTYHIYNKYTNKINFKIQI